MEEHRVSLRVAAQRQSQPEERADPSAFERAQYMKAISQFPYYALKTRSFRTNLPTQLYREL